VRIFPARRESVKHSASLSPLGFQAAGESSVAEGDSRTSQTLIGRLRDEPDNPQAWNAFVDRYGRKVYAWCRQWGLQEADAEDVTQNVLLDLARQMTRFHYRAGGSFRAWLKTIAHRAWCDFLEARRRQRTTVEGDAILDRISSVEAGADLLRTMDEECEREMLEEAMARVKLRVQPHTWEAFRLTALDGRSGAEAGAQLNMQVGAVFVARSKVQKMLQEEVRKLESESP
jgi:RNA polymerase sigma-70 factor (ECF subfamily)